MMKQLFLSALLCSLISCQNGNKNGSDQNSETSLDMLCDCKELAFDQPYNNYYLETPRNGYTGICEEFHGNGQLSLRKNFKKGKLHGSYKSYYENGQLKEDKTFDMNFQVEDAFIYDEEGTLIYHGKFRYGRQIETIFPKVDSLSTN